MRVDKIARDRVNEFEPSFTKRMLIICSTIPLVFKPNLLISLILHLQEDTCQEQHLKFFITIFFYDM